MMRKIIHWLLFIDAPRDSISPIHETDYNNVISKLIIQIK